MRLTLRTMLAYLDDVLEPADAQELGKKIEESDFAGGLVHRIRSSMRRLRLGSPRLDGKRLGLDCNTVAEYLDNTLPKDQAPDFEKVCLESDVYLAEVASCHQILTLVLGEPAEVPTSTRERIYRLGSPTVPAHPEPIAETKRSSAKEGPLSVPAPPPGDEMSPAAPSSSGTTGMEQLASQKSTPAESNVPDYFRQGPRQRYWPLALTVILAFLLVGAALMAVGPLDGWWGATERPDHTVADNGDGPASQGGANAPGEQAARPSDKATGDRLPKENGTIEQPTDVAGPGRQGETEGDVPPEPDVGVGPKDLPGVVTTPSDTDDNPGDGMTGDQSGMKPGEGSEPGGEGGSGAPAGEAPEKSPAKDQPAPAGAGEVVAHFISMDGQVLVRHDAESDSWHRLPARAALAAGDRLLVLPTFRPQILFAVGVHLTLAGAAQVELGLPDQQGVPEVRIAYGRAIISAMGREGAQVVLRFGDHRALATFDDPNAIVAIEVKRFHEPGVDPEAAAAHSLTKVFTTAGPVEWHEDGVDPVVIDAGQARTWADAEPGRTTTVPGIPKWVESEDLSPIDRRASETLAPLLGEGRPVSLSLLEQADEGRQRRVEVRSLAIRCLAELDQFERPIAALGDVQLKSYWSSHVNSLQSALARSPESAAAVRSALEKLRHEDGARLYRMLWGFSAADLKGGRAEDLVKYLSSPAVDYRVLAFENLWRITGLTLSYRPEKEPERQTLSIRRWTEKLASGEIVPKAKTE